MAMSQPRLQAPFLPGEQEAADLVDEQHASGSRDPESSSGSASEPGKFISFFGNSGDGGSETDKCEQRGESRGTLETGSAALVGAGHGVASEVSESLDVVHEKLETGFKGVYGTAKDVVQRAKQGLLDILPSGLSSLNSDQVVEDVEKDVLANSEGSGEDLSYISNGPDDNNKERAQPHSTRETTPTFMRAKL